MAALACLAVLDGIPNRQAVAYVREHYGPRAVETPWQRRFVSGFQQRLAAAAATKPPPKHQTGIRGLAVRGATYLRWHLGQ